MTFPHLRQYLELGGAARARSTSSRTSTRSSRSPPAAWAPPTCRTRSTRPSTRPTTTAGPPPPGVVVVIGTIIIATLALRTVSSLFREETPDERITERGRRQRRRTQHGGRRGAKPAGPGGSAWACWPGSSASCSSSRAVDGADLLPLRADAATNPPSCRAADPGRLPGVLRRGRRASPWPSLVNSPDRQRAVRRVLVLLLAIPAAYALSIRPVRKWTDVMFFFLSTKMLPVGRGPAADLPVRPEQRPAGQHLAAGHPLHVDEPADRRVDDAVLPRRGAGGDPRGAPSWTARA